MKKFSKILALLLALVMVFSMAVTAAAEETEGEAEEETVEEEAAAEEGAGKLVYATSTFGQKFSPFFYTTVYDAEVVSMVTGSLLASDRGGAIVEHGIEGEDREYNGTVYHYDGMGDVEVVQNDDGTVDYFLTMREGVKFSDGVEATIDDVIFGIYVCCDPTYDGSSTIYALPIEGMEEYRSGMDSRGNAIFAAGDAGYEETELWTEDQYNAFWDYYNNQAGADFAQEILDYCVSKGYNSPDDPVEVTAATWGFTDLPEGATAQDFWDAIVAAYETTEEAESVESAGSTRLSLTIAALGAEFEAGVNTGESAASITGIEKTGDYTMTIHMTSYDATAIYSMAFTVAPLHYYGDADLYDYDNNSFGFVKGDLSGVKAVTTQPLGCGPYIFEGYENGVATFTANEDYYLGAPAVKTFLFQESVDSDYVPGTVSGSFDISSPSVNDNTLNAIKDANGGELNGDVVTTYLVDYRGYGYIGINADLVNIDDDPGSDESKALRKGFMTLFAVYRDTVINSYYGDRAAVIQYPISNTSWAAPKPADEGYKLAYSVDADGNTIYTDDMTDEEKYEAAKAAAITWFQAAGFTYDEEQGKFVDVEDTWEVMIPGQGEQDHPAYGIVVAASEVLAELGITLQVNDVVTSVWNNQLEANSAMMWAAAWQASVDPDMTQVYHSDNAHGNGTNSNHYAVDDEALDELIVAGRASADTEERKSIYKEAMEIIMDWGCELPTYQRKDCTIASTERVNIDSMPKDMTPYWGWMAELEKLEAK
ncbi:MAG: ABC transporter substrate-binding protein [Lachnospiraceae bacterium]|nr:ABC transporter substrate-binding protein [Lachnospiraceae bacterium]